MESDPIIEDMLNKNPLVLFSIYTDVQSRTIRELGREIVTCFEEGITTPDESGKGIVCGGHVMNRGYGQFWLWVIGAYEIVRTMCQAERCFSPVLAAELKVLKRQLSVIRMPFAKQELPGKSAPVRGEPSVYGIGHSPPDLKFKVNDQVISAQELISDFDRVFTGIRRADILSDHRGTYLTGAA